MTQDKLRRIITACVVAGTTLLVVLLSVLIFQWVKIGVYNKRIAKAESDVAKLQQAIDEDEEKAKYYEEGTGKFWLAIENGWVKGE